MQEWEVYILAKLNWNIPGVVASDFVDHILKVGVLISSRVRKQSHCSCIGPARLLSTDLLGCVRLIPRNLPPSLLFLVQNLAKLKLGTSVSVAETRSSVQLLVRRCHVSYELSRHPPVLIAAASVLATLTPLVTAETAETSSASLSASPPPRRETEAPSLSQSSATSSPELSRLLSPSYDSTRSPFQVAESPITPIARRLSSGGEDATPARSRASEVERVTRAIQRLTLLDSHALATCSAHLQQLELLAPAHTAGHSDTSASGDRFSTSSPLPTAARSLFKDLETTVKTPTKILDASTSITN